MARLPRISALGIPQHIIQRGNNRQGCFASDQDFAVYANGVSHYAQAFDVAIHAWVFMTNHVHLLATPYSDGGISNTMQALGNERCKDEIERLHGRRVIQARMGRPMIGML